MDGPNKKKKNIRVNLQTNDYQQMFQKFHIYSPSWQAHILQYLKELTTVFLTTHILCNINLCRYGPGSSVGVATGYGLDGLGIETPWGARFSAPVHTGPGAHPASCTMGTGSFPGVKSGQGVTLTPNPFLVPWSRKSKAMALLPLTGRTACTELQCLYKGELYLIFNLCLWVNRGVINSNLGSSRIKIIPWTFSPWRWKHYDRSNRQKLFHRR